MQVLHVPRRFLNGRSKVFQLLASHSSPHSRPQSRVPFGQRHGTKALAGPWSPQIADFRSFCAGLEQIQNGWPNAVTFGPFGLEILGLTNRRLKGKQYEVLKCVVLDNNDVLAVLETVKSLIYQLLPPVFALISWYLEETHREEVYCVHCCGVVGPRKKMSTAWSVPIGQCSPRKSST